MAASSTKVLEREDSSWCSFNEAVEKLSFKFGTGARHVITKELNKGLIRIRASQISNVSDELSTHNPCLILHSEAQNEIVLRGFEIRVRDLDNLINPQDAVDEISQRVGRPPDVVRWTNFWLTVVEIAHYQKLNRSEFANKTALQKDISERMGKSAFSKNTMEPRVRQIWNKFFLD